MKTACGLCFFNDELVLRCLDSITGHFDHIFAIDGKFALNPSKKDYSDESLREKIRKYPDVILIDYVGNEEDKRDQYLIQCQKYNVDVLLIIDSDEYIDKKTDWDLFYEEIKLLDEGIYCINVMPNDVPLPRIWVKPYNFRYYQSHCIFQNIRVGDIISSGQSARKGDVKGLIMQMGKDEPRSEEYLNDTRTYQERMIEKEKEIRKSVNG